MDNADESAAAARVRRHRAELRSRGLRPLQIWVSDTRAPGFAEEANRQSLLVRASEAGDTLVEGDAWFEISDKTGWTA